MGTQVVLVLGAPGAGKTTYVRERLQPGDLIVDFDVLFAALSGQPLYSKPLELVPFVCAARDAVLKRLLRPSEVPTAWIISSEPREKERQSLKRMLGNPEVIELAVSEAECLRRVESDPSRRATIGRWRQVVSGWFQERGSVAKRVDG